MNVEGSKLAVTEVRICLLEVGSLEQWVMSKHAKSVLFIEMSD